MLLTSLILGTSSNTDGCDGRIGYCYIATITVLCTVSVVFVDAFEVGDSN